MPAATVVSRQYLRATDVNGFFQPFQLDDAAAAGAGGAFPAVPGAAEPAKSNGVKS
jgi:hypothetical protein